jgi:hypothetical protein
MEKRLRGGFAYHQSARYRNLDAEIESDWALKLPSDPVKIVRVYCNSPNGFDLARIYPEQISLILLLC